MYKLKFASAVQKVEILTDSQQRTPDLRLLILAKKSGMLQCTSKTRYLVIPPSSPSLKWRVEPLVTKKT